MPVFRVLDLILARDQATATALAAVLPFTRQAVAKHLAVLVRAGLVEPHRHGREVRYSIRVERLDAAARAMAAAASEWDRRLNAIKHLAEAQASPAQARGPEQTAEPAPDQAPNQE